MSQDMTSDWLPAPEESFKFDARVPFHKYMAAMAVIDSYPGTMRWQAGYPAEDWIREREEWEAMRLQFLRNNQ